MSLAWVAGNGQTGPAFALNGARGCWLSQPPLFFVLSLPDHEAILITLLLIFLLFLPALMMSIYFWYRRENSLLNKWIKEMRRRTQETYRWVMHPKSLLSSGPSETPNPCFLATGSVQPGRNSYWGAGGAQGLFQSVMRPG